MRVRGMRLGSWRRARGHGVMPSARPRVFTDCPSDCCRRGRQRRQLEVTAGILVERNSQIPETR